MKIAGVAFALVAWIGAGVGRAEDDPAAHASAPAQLTAPLPVSEKRAGTAIDAATGPPGRPRGVAPGATQDAAPPGGANATAAPAAFVAEEKWGLAGYNNNEPVYTILVTSHDARIIRCTADLKGTYIENGQKLSISDRQTATVFPNEQAQLGNWSGMDQASGATYSVKCRPV